MKRHLEIVNSNIKEQLADARQEAQAAAERLSRLELWEVIAKAEGKLADLNQQLESSRKEFANLQQFLVGLR